MRPAGRLMTPVAGMSALYRRLVRSFRIKPVLCSLMLVLPGTGFAVSAELDDSALFIEAYNAYQQKDYLLAIEKITTLNQLFPDTPLRDVTLLLLARSGLRSGDLELAGKTASRFTREFAAHPFRNTTEDELLRLAARWQQGEKIPPAAALRTAALKVRNDRLAAERAPIEEREARERLQREQAEQERMALEKAAAERRERERLAREQIDRESIKAAISVPGEAQPVAAGQQTAVPFEVANLGTADERFLLEAAAPAEYGVSLSADGRTPLGGPVTIATGKPFKGSILVRMPAGRMDGHKAAVTLRVVSERFRHQVQTLAAHVVAAAPLVRVVAKPEKAKLVPGERTHYLITLLNAGSLPAQGLTVRVQLPPQLELLGQGGPKQPGVADSIVIPVRILETGKLTDFTLDVKVRDDARAAQELRCRVEVMNAQLQTKETFTSTAAVIQLPAAPARKP